MPMLPLALFVALVPLNSGPASEGHVSAGVEGEGAALEVRSTGLRGWLAGPRDRGLAQALEALEAYLAEEAELEPEAEVGALALRLLGDPFELRVGGTHRAPRVGLTVFTSAAPLRVAELASLMQAADLRPSSVDGARALELPVGELRFGAIAAANEVPARFWLTLGEVATDPAAAETPGAALSVRWDGRAATPLLRPLLEEDGGPYDWLEARGLLGERGASGWFELTREGGGAHFRASAPLRASDEDGPGHLRATSLARVPADSLLAGVSSWDPMGLVRLVDGIEAGSSAKLRLGAKKLAGVDPVGDLLAHLDGAAGGFVTSSTGGSLLSTVLFAESTRPVAVRNALERLAVVLADGPAQGRLTLRHFEHNGVECTALAFPGAPVPAEPSFAVAGGALYVAAHSNGLREALDQLGTSRSLLDRPELKAAGVSASGLPSGLTGLSFVDAPAFLNGGYGRLAQLASMLENLARSERGIGRQIGPLLPPLAELSAGARPWVGTSRVVGERRVHQIRCDDSWTAGIVALAGSPLAQAGGMLSAVAIPNLLSARLSANESAAVATLRSLASAQQLFRATGVVDLDADGAGEYGHLGDLAGVRTPRGADAPLEPALVAPGMAPIDDGRGQAVMVRHGYVFQVFVGTRRGKTVIGVPEPMAARTGPSGQGLGPNPDGAERYWCAYAWPLEPGRTGNRAFVIDQTGALHFTTGGRYGGLAGEGGATPRFDAAYSSVDDLSSPLADGSAGEAASDGARWEALDAAR